MWERPDHQNVFGIRRDGHKNLIAVAPASEILEAGVQAREEQKVSDFLDRLETDVRKALNAR